MLEPLQKLLRLSAPVAATLSHPQLFARTVTKLANKKAVVRVNLLRIIRSICDASEEEGALVRLHGLYEAIKKLAEHDPAILVRNMAADLIRLCDQSDRQGMDGARYRHPRRTSSSTMTPPPLYTSSSLPPTPQRSSGQSNSGYFELPFESYQQTRSRASNINGSIPYRPVSRDGLGITKNAYESPSPAISNGNASLSSASATPAIKSRLPRTNPTRLSRSNTASTFREENMPPPPTPTSLHGPPAAVPHGNMVINPRRRRQTSGGLPS